MWTIIKYDKKNFSILVSELKKKIGEDLIVYNPKIQLKKFKNRRLVAKSVNLIGDYFFCYHTNFEKKTSIQKYKFCKGLKYFLDGYLEFQHEIISFINKCKSLEDHNGFVAKSFCDIDLFKNYKFLSGPFSEKIFKVIELKKNRINILMGNVKTTINKKEFLFSPV